MYTSFMNFLKSVSDLLNTPGPAERLFGPEGEIPFLCLCGFISSLLIISNYADFANFLSRTKSFFCKFMFNKSSPSDSGSSVKPSEGIIKENPELRDLLASEEQLNARLGDELNILKAQLSDLTDQLQESESRNRSAVSNSDYKAVLDDIAQKKSQIFELERLLGVKGAEIRALSERILELKSAPPPLPEAPKPDLEALLSNLSSQVLFRHSFQKTDLLLGKDKPFSFSAATAQSTFDLMTAYRNFFNQKVVSDELFDYLKLSQKAGLLFSDCKSIAITLDAIANFLAFERAASVGVNNPSLWLRFNKKASDTLLKYSLDCTQTFVVESVPYPVPPLSLWRDDEPLAWVRSIQRLCLSFSNYAHLVRINPDDKLGLAKALEVFYNSLMRTNRHFDYLLKNPDPDKVKRFFTTTYDPGFYERWLKAGSLKPGDKKDLGSLSQISGNFAKARYSLCRDYFSLLSQFSRGYTEILTAQIFEFAKLSDPFALFNRYKLSDRELLSIQFNHFYARRLFSLPSQTYVPKDLTFSNGFNADVMQEFEQLKKVSREKPVIVDELYSSCSEKFLTFSPLEPTFIDIFYGHFRSALLLIKELFF